MPASERPLRRSCTAGETRTLNRWFWRPVLYQLSYRRIRLETSRIRRMSAEARIPPPGKGEGRSPEQLPVPRLIERCQLSRLPVCGVLPATRAELRKLDPVGIVLAVLRRPVRARPAGRARKRDDRSVVLWH